jgi:hypothetical protein
MQGDTLTNYMCTRAEDSGCASGTTLTNAAWGTGALGGFSFSDPFNAGTYLPFTQQALFQFNGLVSCRCNACAHRMDSQASLTAWTRLSWAHLSFCWTRGSVVCTPHIRACDAACQRARKLNPTTLCPLKNAPTHVFAERLPDVSCSSGCVHLSACKSGALDLSLLTLRHDLGQQLH